MPSNSAGASHQGGGPALTGDLAAMAAQNQLAVQRQQAAGMMAASSAGGPGGSMDRKRTLGLTATPGVHLVAPGGVKVEQEDGSSSKRVRMDDPQQRSVLTKVGCLDPLLQGGAPWVEAVPVSPPAPAPLQCCTPATPPDNHCCNACLAPAPASPFAHPPLLFLSRPLPPYTHNNVAMPCIDSACRPRLPPPFLFLLPPPPPSSSS